MSKHRKAQGHKPPGEMSYWDERMKVLASQAEELRPLSADLVAKTSEPIREHMRAAWVSRPAGRE